MLATTPLRTIEFTVPGEAVPYARTGGGKTVVRFTPQKQRNYMGVVKFYAQRAMQGAAPIEGPIELSISAVYQRPKSRRLTHDWKTSRADASNVVKLLEDALNGISWRDDAQVCSLHVWKTYGDVPGVKIRIVEMVAP